MNRSSELSRNGFSEVNNLGFKAEKELDRRDQMQSSFLNHCRKDRVPMFLDMISGEKAAGIIIGFDESTIILEQNNSQSLFFKRNIACVRPKREVNYIFNEAYRYRGNYSTGNKYYS